MILSVVNEVKRRFVGVKVVVTGEEGELKGMGEGRSCGSRGGRGSGGEMGLQSM